LQTMSLTTTQKKSQFRRRQKFEPRRYRLVVVIHSAKDLLSKDRNGFSDPYVVVSIAGDDYRAESLKRTKVKSKTLHPQFEQTFEFRPPFANSALLFSVWDKDLLSADDFLGCHRFSPISKIFSEGEKKGDIWEMRNVELPLGSISLPRLRREKTGGMLRISLQLEEVVPKLQIFNVSFSQTSESLKRGVTDSGVYRMVGQCRDLDDPDEGSTDPVIIRPGVTPNDNCAVFSGMNRIEFKQSPLLKLPEWSMSIWFYTNDASKDYVLLSCFTSDPHEVVDEKKNRLSLKGVISSPLQMVKKHEYGVPKTVDTLSNVIHTKTFKSGFAIGTKANLFYNNQGEALNANPIDMQSSDNIFERHVHEVDPNEPESADLVSDINDDWDRSEMFENGKLNHVIVTYNGAHLKEYVNAVLIDTQACNYSLLGDGSGRLTIGGLVNDSDFTGFRGGISRVQIFNYALSQKDVLKLVKGALKRV